jgi:glycosyltransferase involved in cell wall biosynthesis
MPSKPLRVLQVGMSDNYGGTEAVVYGVYNHLDHSQVQFDFLNVYGHPLAKQSELEAQGAHVYGLLLKRREGYFRYAKGIKEFYKQHAGEFDAVVCNVQCLDQIDMAKWGRKFGIAKRIVYLHNAGNGIAPSRLAKIAIGWNKRHAQRYVSDFVAISSLASRWGFGKKQQKQAQIIPNGIAIDHFAFSPKNRADFRQKFSLSEATLVFGFAGRFDPQKNPLFLLDIFNAIYLKNPSARFLIAGRGPLERQVREKAASLACGKAITIITDLDDLAPFYSAIDAFILPSLFEGLGLVLVEAQCSGLPCLASEKTIPEEAQVLPSFKRASLSDTADQWAEAALELSFDFPREQGTQFVRKAHYDVVETAKAYLELLNHE